VAPGLLAEGHSAGGIALRNVAENVQRVKVRAYLFLDASFQSWADGCYRAIEDRKADSKMTLVITDRGIADPFGKRDPWCETTPKLVERFGSFASFCASHPSEKPPGERKECSELTELVQDWPDKYEPWCDALANDMADVDNVYVHRTKIPHGKQPRHFSGGLELPADRFSPSP
jgi:hypothetical protein